MTKPLLTKVKTLTISALFLGTVTVSKADVLPISGVAKIYTEVEPSTVVISGKAAEHIADRVFAIVSWSNEGDGIRSKMTKNTTCFEDSKYNPKSRKYVRISVNCSIDLE